MSGHALVGRLALQIVTPPKIFGAMHAVVSMS